MRFYWLALGILAVWRVTHLLNAEDGPGDVFVHFRRWLGQGFWGSLLDCFYCLSMWIAAPLACCIGDNWMESFLLWPALSGGAILVERLTVRPAEPVPEATIIYEKKRSEDDLLRE